MKTNNEYCNKTGVLIILFSIWSVTNDIFLKKIDLSSVFKIHEFESVNEGNILKGIDFFQGISI